MAKLEEIIDHYIPPVCQGSWHKEMMIEYAEWYAKKCLEIAAEKALVIRRYDAGYEPNVDDTLYEESSYIRVYKDSILNIKIPDHD